MNQDPYVRVSEAIEFAELFLLAIVAGWAVAFIVKALRNLAAWLTNR